MACLDIDKIVQEIKMKVDNQISDFIHAEIIKQDGGTNLQEFTFNMEKIKSAIEKQIPKQPQTAPIKDSGINFCPICGAVVTLPKAYVDYSFKLQYCHKCGQKIDWSSEGEGEWI